MHNPGEAAPRECEGVPSRVMPSRRSRPRHPGTEALELAATLARELL
jgi:hypothetical protein